MGYHSRNDCHDEYAYLGRPGNPGVKSTLSARRALLLCCATPDCRIQSKVGEFAWCRCLYLFIRPEHADERESIPAGPGLETQPVDSSEGGASGENPLARRSNIDEVVVTAQKRSENEQNVPMSLQVLSAAKLADEGAVQLSDYTQQIPGNIHRHYFLDKDLYQLYSSVAVKGVVAASGGILLWLAEHFRRLL